MHASSELPLATRAVPLAVQNSMTLSSATVIYN